MKTFIKKLCYLISMIIYRIKINGKENLPEDGAALICPNHVHALDSVVLIAHAKRDLNALAKEELFKSKVFKWITNYFGIYPVKQNSADLTAIKTALKVLKNNELLLVFPEGTRNGIEKGIPAKNGPVMIAAKAGVPIIPIGIKGNFKAFSKITINIGKPIYYDEYKNKMNDKEIVSKLTQDLIHEIIRLRDI